ncbi:MAG: methyltransferase [Bacteroidales bacterium]|nr:methyltransferase [Bacteroidales bacterium]
MNLSADLKKNYCRETLSARQAQRQAQFIAWGPVVFQVARIMVDSGILEMLRDNDEGLTVEAVAEKSGLSEYAVRILLEGSLSIGIVLVDADRGRYMLSKTGWFLLTDASTRVNMAFNHYVNYLGLYDLDKALKDGTPAGLKRLGDWPTVYEGLSRLAPDVSKAWFDFDHFYSDNSFDDALRIVFDSGEKVKHLMDIGGNTGRWALRCVEHDADVEVTVVDLPQQIGLLKENISGHKGAERIHGYGTDMLDSSSALPSTLQWDVIWMSQFLDCFSEEQIVDILRRVAEVASPQTRIMIMETLWDRQRFEPAALCLTMTSVYFTAIANGNSKMYHSDRFFSLIEKSGLKIESVADDLGLGHSIITCGIK